MGGHGEESKCDTSKYSLIHTIDPYDGWDSGENGGNGDIVMRKYAPNKPAADPDLSVVAGHKVSEVPPTNGRFCATVKLADANPYVKSVTFNLCVDSTNLASGKVWQHLSNGQTSIWDGTNYTTELQGDQCSAYPADSNHFWGTFNRVLAVPSDATQLDNQTWARKSYENWEGSNHTCTGNNAGTRTRESWTLSETMTNGTYDVLKHVTTFEDCEGGEWHLQQEDDGSKVDGPCIFTLDKKALAVVDSLDDGSGCNIDCFASSVNRRAGIDFNSRFFQPGAAAVDAFGGRCRQLAAPTMGNGRVGSQALEEVQKTVSRNRKY